MTPVRQCALAQQRFRFPGGRGETLVIALLNTKRFKNVRNPLVEHTGVRHFARVRTTKTE